MKFLKAALLLNLVLISNAGYAIEILNLDIRSDLSSPLISSTPRPVLVTNIQNFVWQSGGNINVSGVFNVENPSAKWDMINRVINTPGSLIVGGSISIGSPLILTTTGPSISVTQITLAATAVPEADTYLMLLAGWGLVGATVARRSAR
ncbi:MAG TPA: PEP-CTERM sorting domain-containing protein [Methylophilus sp.]|uniref:PEP-CTERM sorting domain-containing protein n=1 Tax=Methylophilus sp. TaxID=29541 RepID=UPI002C76FDDA|nr:PEP-CTERM sorting domain-containing protein [Methylophilus sp.]HSH87466.1 PEP-CTERM sorting domain-containing protein [Methylophilus sp.]